MNFSLAPLICKMKRPWGSCATTWQLFRSRTEKTRFPISKCACLLATGISPLSFHEQFSKFPLCLFTKSLVNRLLAVRALGHQNHFPSFVQSWKNSSVTTPKNESSRANMPALTNPSTRGRTTKISTRKPKNRGSNIRCNLCLTKARNTGLTSMLNPFRSTARIVAVRALLLKTSKVARIAIDTGREARREILTNSSFEAPNSPKAKTALIANNTFCISDRIYHKWNQISVSFSISA